MLKESLGMRLLHHNKHQIHLYKAASRIRLGMSVLAISFRLSSMKAGERCYVHGGGTAFVGYFPLIIRVGNVFD